MQAVEGIGMDIGWVVFVRYRCKQVYMIPVGN
jgi:hypothetical protein